MSGIRRIAIGVDVGSTTVKAVVCDPDSFEILWQDYQRHETRQPEMVQEFLVRIGDRFPDADDVRVYCTGSGSGPLAEPLGAKFVQEVNAVTLAVERLHPDVGSVIELGGQDAKIILFREQQGEDGTVEKTAITSMNDKCASGTGATIDKCMIKVGMQPEEVGNLALRPCPSCTTSRPNAGCSPRPTSSTWSSRASPATEIMNSLADAIVHQNLSVLTRGNTLRDQGAPARRPKLPTCRSSSRMLADAHPGDLGEPRLRLPEGRPHRRARLHPRRRPVLRGLRCGGVRAHRRLRRPTEGALQGARRAAALHPAAVARVAPGDSAAGPAGRGSHDERDRLPAQDYTIPKFDPPAIEPGSTWSSGVIGLDGGSTSSKSRALSTSRPATILYKAYTLSKGNPIQRHQGHPPRTSRAFVEGFRAQLCECVGFGATGYAADVLEESVCADVNIVETVAHMLSAVRFVPRSRRRVRHRWSGHQGPVPDRGEKVGGRDVRDFRLSQPVFSWQRHASPSHGRSVRRPSSTNTRIPPFEAGLSPKFSHGLRGVPRRGPRELPKRRVRPQAEDAGRPGTGAAQKMSGNTWSRFLGWPNSVSTFVLQGGTQRNLAAVKGASGLHPRTRVPDAKVVVHPHSAEAGAIGAAMETRRVVRPARSAARSSASSKRST